jgi:hypothetical protein
MESRSVTIALDLRLLFMSAKKGRAAGKVAHGFLADPTAPPTEDRHHFLELLCPRGFTAFVPDTVNAKRERTD